MALSRRAKYGFPPPAQPTSHYTSRQVPLTVGVQDATAWPLLPAGSANSMANFLPLDGKLIPRSRLSSINTIRGLNAGYGMAEIIYASQVGQANVWYSAGTTHAIIHSNGSISKASFVSAGGLGIADLETQASWQYAVAFGANLGVGENMLVAAGVPSYDTLLALYQQGGTSAGAAVYSYLTSAPKAKAIAAFDNYLLAWNVQGTGAFITRVQWCVRGEPDNWTGEGSGFEDLLEMSGTGTAVKGMADGRVILFTDREIWYGQRAAYPAQFQFYPLDKSLGCPAPKTIAETPGGLIFVGSDWKLHILPSGGGLPAAIAPQLNEWLRRRPHVDSAVQTWGLYDQQTNLYYLFVERISGTIDQGAAVNLATGEIGLLDYSLTITPSAGLALGTVNTANHGKSEGLLFVDSTGTVYSTNSTLARDANSVTSTVVACTWRSAPIASDLPGDWKQLLDVYVDYRATSRSTLTLKIAGDGNTFESTGRTISLTSAPYVGRAKGEVYAGGAFPRIELSSSGTGYELHRLDVTMHLGGRA